MSLTYSSFVSSFANMLVVPSTDTRFVTYLPNAIDYAEQRLYRDLQLLNTVVTDASGSFGAGNPGFGLPTTTGVYLVVDSICVLTPLGASILAATLNPLTPASLDWVQGAWPNSTGSGVPQYFAMVTQGVIRVGPWPDQAYTVQVIGTQRPAPLSASNTTTGLCSYFPDLFLTAAMIFGAGAIKNFGAQSDDPKSGVSWETQYQTLLQSAQTEEAMKKFTAAGWSSKAPAPLATPRRV